MKVILSRPWNETSMLIPNHGLGYLATAIRKIGHEPVIIDCIRDKIHPEAFLKRIEQEKPHIVGFQVYTFDLPALTPYVKALKNMNIVMVAGGPHPSAAPKDMLKRFPDIHVFLRGEAETSFPQLIDLIHQRGSLPDKNELLHIPGCYTHETSDPQSVSCHFVDDLDSLGFPDWDQISPLDYPIAPQGTFTKQLPVAPIIITRGCPYPCTFCAGKLISGKKIRCRSVPNVIEEILMLKNKFGIREFHIQDDNFTFDKDYVLQFCEALKKQNTGLVWACPNGIRLDSIDEEMLKAMDEAGCYSVAVGIESGNQRILDLMKKKTSLNDLIFKVRQIRQLTQWQITGFFILGYPGETRDEMENTIRLSRRLPLNKVNFGILMPLPGTEAERAACESGWNPETDLLRMSEYRSPFTPEGMTPSEFRNVFRRAFIGFYIRPAIIWQFLKQIKSKDQFMILLRRFKDVVTP